MTTMKKAVVSACIVLILISACIGPAAAAINIWGADSASKDSQTNAQDYNEKIAAENAQWYYDSVNNVLWTDGGNLVLPVYMNVTSDDTTTNVWGYNLTLAGEDTSLTNLVAQKGAYKAAYILSGAKISASVSRDGNESVINKTSSNPANIVNASFDATAVGNYSIKLTNAKLATSTTAVNSLDDLSAGTITNINNVIAFKVMTKPFVDYFTIAGENFRRNSTTPSILYFYYERDHNAAGTLLTANITNMDTTDKFDWKLGSSTSSGDLKLELAEKTAQADNFTTVNLTGTKAVGAYNNSVANITVKRTGESHLVNVNATYWNQSASVDKATAVDGSNITFTYKVAAVPQAYVTGASSKWDTYVELYPIGTAAYQNYTIYTTGQTNDYTVINGTGPVGSEDKGVKNLTVTKSTKTGSDGPITITLKSGINGDPNEDGTVDIVDGAGVGIETIRVASPEDDSILKTAQQQFLADVDKSGVVTVADVLAIHAYIVEQ